MKNNHKHNIGGVIFLFILVYFIYRILLEDDILPFSISAVQTTMNHWVKHWHFLVVGLIPVYIAFVFFGAMLVGILFGERLQHWISKFFID
ncbi:MAG TPA: hypothetical protein VHM20_08560 [Gammaproteobacteria bacterium]|jgi:hypothetical protein|nr:hypothetical protein [Gammaproteobacteria bacterium]